jgi:type I restriction enzyme S subunit
MAGRYKAYPEYKDSGVELLGDIPSGWVVDKFRYLFSLGRGLGITKANLQDSGILCVNYGEIHSKYGFEVSPDTHPLRCVSELYLESSPNSLLSNGDCIFADTSEDIEGAGNFTQLTSDQALFAGYHTVIARPKGENDARFLAYVFDSPAYRTQIRLGVKGVKVFSITQEILKNTDLWLAPLPEQKQIAKFLDHETAKIDLLIAKQQALIALLKEKRQAVISHAVTKGLNPNAKMKDSGVEWLGQVPEEWKVIKLGITISKATLGGNHPAGEGEEGLPLIKMGNLGRGSIKLQKVENIPIREPYEEEHLLSEGDFLFNTRNSLDLVGKVSIWRGELGKALYNSNILRVRFREDFVGSTAYMNHLFNSDLGLSLLRLVAKGTTSVAAIYYKELSALIFCLPPVAEQMEIAAYLDSKLGRFEGLINGAEAAVDLLQERRTALISAAVTGKIDVRDFAPEAETDKSEVRT